MLDTTLKLRQSLSGSTTANFGRRLNAAFIDLFLLTLLVFLFKLAIPNISNTLFFYKTTPPFKEGITIWVLSKSSLIGIWIIYSIIMDCSTLQGTLGKQMMRVIVTDENGKRVTVAKSIKRNLFKIVSFTFAGLGFLFILIDKKNRSWHDNFANTLIIQKPV